MVISRRSFLKLAGMSLGSLAFRSWNSISAMNDFPQSERLGRTFTKTEIKSRPDINAQTVSVLYDDAVVPCLREVVGYHPYRYKQRWVETPEGFIWASELQPVRNLPNQPLKDLPQTSLGSGMWVEVSVPWVEIILENKPISPGLRNKVKEGMALRRGNKELSE